MIRYVLVATIAAGVGFATEAWSQGDQELTVERAVKIALERNPELKAAAAEVEAAKARLAGAGALLPGNPEIEAEGGYRESPGGERTREYRIGVAQSFAIAGQRGARRDLTGAELRAAVARLERQRTVVASDVRRAFVRWMAAVELQRLADETEKLARETLAAAEERHRAGAGTRIEMNTARAGIGRAARERTLSLQQQAAARAELRLLLGLDAGTPVVVQGELQQVGALESTSRDGLAARALEHRADLRAAKQDLEAAKAARSLAIRETVPDVRIGASVGKEEQATVVLGTVAVPLPLFQRNQTARGVALAEISRAEIVVAGLERRVREEVEVAFLRYEGARAAAKVYAGDVLASLQENASLVNEAYKAGKVNLFELTFIRRETLEARRAYIEILEELGEARAELDRAVGVTP